ncbi:MAG: hypothetical protein PHX25_01400 [Candidatus Pacebacteria bacterium]|nr:hypothetical protein [Candidatus Paceibacterota bacterium]
MISSAKKRLNITLSNDDIKFLDTISKREKKPTATKARELLEMAIELHEDYQIEKLIKEREKNSTGKFVKAEDVCWN